MADLLRMSAVVAGENEAVLTEWLIPEGGSFSPRDVVATVETAKASFEVEAETAGVLLRQLVGAGAQVTVGTPLAVTGAPGESADQAAAELGLTGAPSVGSGAGADGTRADAADAAAPASGAGANGSRAEAAATAPAPASGREHGRIFASPIARRLARDAGVPIDSITGTGPNGRIIRRDVEAAVASRGAVASSPAAARPTPGQDLSAEQVDRAPAASEPAAVSAAAPATATPPASVPAPSAPPPQAVAEVGEGVRDVPHSRLRRAIAARLTESKQTAPHFYLRGTADVERLCRLREWLNASSAVKITLNDLVIKAAAHAHTRVPAMNVIWTPDAVRHFSAVDLSVAIATDEGLVTPVIRGVDRLSVSAIAVQVREQAERARTGRLRQQDLQGGVATITNLGMFGTEEFAAIINPPQSSILAVGAAREAPVVRKGKVRVRRVMTVTLSVDHRPVDGVTAARWMQAFTALLEDPAQVLA
jgi:pyruvate dehydrogenase E2 component (dihydrolipoamide acetyltransferase)